MAYISGIGTAVPLTRYRQADCWAVLRDAPRYTALTPAARQLLQRVLLGDSGISTRALALDPLAEVHESDADALHARYRRHAPSLAATAARRALDDAGVDPAAVDGVVISTCTGYLCPGLTSYVAEALGLRRDVTALDLVGQGCGAALPNLATADVFVAARRCDTVLSICVEVCSAAYYLDDDPGVLVSACLFGDGAGAAVLTREPRGARPLEWVAGASRHVPERRDALRFEQRGGLLRNILTPAVPALAARHAREVCLDTLERQGLHTADISAWAWHAGGKRVLDGVRDALALTEADVAASRAVLDAYGNLSSAFVYFVLERLGKHGAPRGWWWLSAFGAGFSCHGTLLRAA